MTDFFRAVGTMSAVSAVSKKYIATEYTDFHRQFLRVSVLSVAKSWHSSKYFHLSNA